METTDYEATCPPGIIDQRPQSESRLWQFRTTGWTIIHWQNGYIVYIYSGWPSFRVKYKAATSHKDISLWVYDCILWCCDTRENSSGKVLATLSGAGDDHDTLWQLEITNRDRWTLKLGEPRHMYRWPICLWNFSDRLSGVHAWSRGDVWTVCIPYECEANLPSYFITPRQVIFYHDLATSCVIIYYELVTLRRQIIKGWLAE